MGAIRVYGQKLQDRENEAFKTVSLSVTETCADVLPRIMKKWRVSNDWKKYALFMVSNGKGEEEKWRL